MPKEPAPLKLKIVAYLSLLSGVSAVIKCFVSLSHNSLYLPFDALGIPICFGLLYYRPAWRTLALIFIWIALVMLPIIFGMGFFAQTTYFEFLGIHIADIPRILFFILAIAVYSLVVWQYRVLTDHSIKRLFHEPA